MRHRCKTNKLGRTTSHRKAMLDNMVSSLISHQKVRTTVAKAKEAKKLADRVITLAKHGALKDRRAAFGILQDRSLVKRLFDEIAPNFSHRPGGYTRLLRCGPRPGDGAEMAILELVEVKTTPPPKGKPAKKVKAPKEEKLEPTPKKSKGVPPKKEKPALPEAPEPEAKEEKPSPPEAKPKGSKFLEGLRRQFRRKT